MTPIPLRVEDGKLPPDTEAMERQAAAQAYFESLPWHKKFSLTIRTALVLKAQRPQFRGHPPRGIGLRAQARAQGFSNQTHMAREWYEAQKAAGVVPA